MKKISLLLFFMTSFVLFGCTKLKTEVTYTLNPGRDTILIGETWIDEGITIKYGDTELTVTTDQSDLNNLAVGTYKIMYEAVHRFVHYSYVRYVQVIDGVAPMIELNPGVDTVFVGDTWIDAGVILNDDTDTSPSLVVTGSVDTSVAGTYTITYTATDHWQNNRQCIRIVTVIERED